MFTALSLCAQLYYLSRGDALQLSRSIMIGRVSRSRLVQFFSHDTHTSIIFRSIANPAHPRSIVYDHSSINPYYIFFVNRLDPARSIGRNIGKGRDSLEISTFSTRRILNSFDLTVTLHLRILHGILSFNDRLVSRTEEVSKFFFEARGRDKKRRYALSN